MIAQQAQNFHDAASELRFEHRAFINGKFTESRSGNTLETVNPTTGDTITQVSECDKTDIDLAVASARNAFESETWSRRPPREHKKTLLKFADLIEKNLAALALTETLGSGKPINDATGRPT
jgi:4-(gamma-glutamylamino)butanal dehydrogenase